MHVSKLAAGAWTRHTARRASTTAGELLASLVNHERTGLPAGAGVAGAAGFDLVSGSVCVCEGRRVCASQPSRSNHPPTLNHPQARMHRLLAALGNPHTSLRAVHVVGSKGKGSVASMLASSAHAAGLRVGLYTSPHVVSVAERVWIDGGPMSVADFDAVAASHADAISRVAANEHGALSWFETVTALTLRAFADAGVDLAVLEAGVGGATDATNVFGEEGRRVGAQPPLAAVVAPVTREHAAVLGGDVASIATTKAGVLSGGAPLIVGVQPHVEATTALVAAAERAGSPLVDVGAAVRVASITHTPADANAGAAPRTRIDVKVHHPLAAPWSSDGEDVTLIASLGLFGEHQAANAATAVAAAAALASRGLPQLTPSAVVAGLQAARLPGRFQVGRLPASSPGAPRVALVLDGAHTPASASALAAAVRYAFPSPAPLALVLATAADKDTAGMAAALRVGLAPVAAVFTETSFGGGRARAVAPGALVAAWQAAPKPPTDGVAPVRCRELIKAGMAAAVDAAAREVAARGRGGAIVVAGSLAGAGDAARSVQGWEELV